MNSFDELVKLIEAVVEKKLNAARLNVQNITGGGGNTTVSSMGDVFLQPGVGKAAYYKGAELATGGSLGSYLPLTAGSSKALTGDLYIDKTTPAVILKHSGTIKGYVQATNTEFDVYPNGVPMSLGDGTLATTIYGSTITATSDLFVDKATPALILKNSGTIKGYVQATSTEFDVYPNGVAMSLGDLGQVLYGRGSSVVFKTAVGDVTRLTIADALITSAVDLTIDKATPGLVLKNSGTIKGYVQATASEFDVYPSGVTMSLGDATQAIEVYCTQLDMNSKKIVGLASPTLGTDAATKAYVDSVAGGSYLPLTAGSGSPLTGDLYIDKATPGVVLKNSGTIKGYVQATATEFDVYPNGVKMSLGDAGQALEEYGSSIVFKTNATPVTRLTIADAYISTTVPLYPATTDAKELGDSTHYWSNVYAQKYYVDDASTYISNVTGDFQINVATGKVVKIVVG